MNKEELEKRFNVTKAQLDALAAPFERGEWPEGRTTLLGRSRLAEEEIRTVTFKLPVSQIAALDGLAEKAGIPVPHIDGLITLCSTFNGEDYREKGRSLQKLGLADKSLDEIVQFVLEGA